MTTVGPVAGDGVGVGGIVGSGCNGSGVPMVALADSDGGDGLRLGTGTLAGGWEGASVTGSGVVAGGGGAGLFAHPATRMARRTETAVRRPGHTLAGRVMH